MHAGSSFAMEYRGKLYVVTAAHVIEHLPDSKSGELYIGVLNHNQFYIGEKTSDSKLVLKNQNHDFALIEITGPAENAIRAQGFVRENEVAFHGGAIDDHYYVCMGYPHSRNRRQDVARQQMGTELVTYGTMYQTDEMARQRSEINEAYHLAMCRNNKVSRDPEGNRKEAYGFKGMSGGPVIDAGALGSTAMIGCTDNVEPKVIAIIFEFHNKHQTIKSLRMKVVKNSLQDLLS